MADTMLVRRDGFSFASGVAFSFGALRWLLLLVAWALPRSCFGRCFELGPGFALRFAASSGHFATLLGDGEGEDLAGARGEFGEGEGMGVPEVLLPLPGGED